MNQLTTDWNSCQVRMLLLFFFTCASILLYVYVLHSSWWKQEGCSFFLFEVWTFDLRQWKLFKASQSCLKERKRCVCACVRVKDETWLGILRRSKGSLQEKKKCTVARSCSVLASVILSCDHNTPSSYLLSLSRFCLLPSTAFHSLPSCSHGLKLKRAHRRITLQLTCNHCSLLGRFRGVVQHTDIWMGRAALGSRKSQLFTLTVTQHS